MARQVSRRSFMLTGAAGAAALGVRPAHGSPAGLEPVVLDRPIPVMELPTPALLIDLDAFEANLQTMAAHCTAKGVGVRPHGKTHKCPIIAKRQVAIGAIGMCAAKVSEAEVFVDGGIANVLITSPVTTRDKIDRVIALARKSPGIQMVVDNETAARALDDAAGAAGITLPVLIDLDSGSRRTGIQPGGPALELLRAIAKMRHLRFDGLQAYSGHVMHVGGFEARRARSVASLMPCLETKALMEREGFAVKIFTGGGTGTYNIDSELEGVTDLQVGSYPFMDVQYRIIGDADSELFDDFAPALFVLATAISQPVPDRITIDAGFKAFAHEPNARPQVRDITGVDYSYGGDEHGILRLTSPSRPIHLGDKLELFISHCDPTVNLYDAYYPYRDGVVHEVWPIAARGKSQ
jgi:D-serine deaminase-like pyridoxal phosphate-dependent protein